MSTGRVVAEPDAIKPHAQRRDWRVHQCPAPLSTGAMAMSDKYLHEWWVNLAAGAQQAKPATDRQSLEAALLDMDYPGRSVSVRIVIDAARQHLETLPKPDPMFQVVMVRRSTGERTRRPDGGAGRKTVVRMAADSMATGEYNSVAVEQVSP